MFSRGVALRKLLVIAVLALSLLQVGLADTKELQPGIFVSGVPTEEFVYFAAPESTGRQLQSNWCWAACIQMVLNYHGLFVSQEQIVSRVYGRLVDRPAVPDQILGALSGWAPDVRGGYSAIYADSTNITEATVIDDLHRRWPLIVGLGSLHPGEQGHAFVMTGVIYQFNAYNQPVILEVILRDPFPGNRSRVEMGADEFFARLQFAARIYVERL